ncbi:unnamed protein product [Vitrella brassicaformis CCMP3155]|uniref:Uncharacterized protein n=1 Tax=Vitrella brassicaformis (strain CCMP3155) TaxID=1169540 RepID=A0A0G4ESR5_VITBC|nr:unnamed protein product [Vitrella brassicaformis CCMP3155]|eukprot:CEM01687.1 unnamed protein product [Vitrella brassicaformis CCMP3155]
MATPSPRPNWFQRIRPRDRWRVWQKTRTPAMRQRIGTHLRIFMLTPSELGLLLDNLHNDDAFARAARRCRTRQRRRLRELRDKLWSEAPIRWLPGVVGVSILAAVAVTTHFKEIRLLAIVMIAFVLVVDISIETCMWWSVADSGDHYVEGDQQMPLVNGGSATELTKYVCEGGKKATVS